MRKKFVLFGISILLLILFLCTPSSAQNYDDYAPIFYFEGEETCFPINAEFHIQNSYLLEIENSVPISMSPTGSELSTYSAEIDFTYYLDNQRGSIDNYNQIIIDSQNYENINGYTVYYRAYNDQTTGEAVIQYWMFYAFNKGELNQHEGDWEMVEIIFNAGVPSLVAYSQHHSGQQATWSQVEKNGNNIKVYVARGSHANYLRSYSGKLGIASDIVGANGKILTPSDYTLKNLDDEEWIDFRGRWGEVGEEESSAIESSILGQAGPEGPKYRENGAMWDGYTWGNSLIPADDMIFTLEWIFYNFIMLFIIVTVAILALMGYRIYRRHKKYGLGPRIVSIFYINGLNLHSIGNILCIVGIILAFIGIFNPWYFVSYGASGTGITETFQTEGMADLLSFDGINGLQVTIPGTSGPIPMGSFVLPFSLFIAIGLIFMIIATIGIPLSKKLGGKYIWRGVRLLIPFILILILIYAIASVVPSIGEQSGASTYLRDIINPITSSPFGGQSTTTITDLGLTAQINLQWGLGSGAWMLLIAGIIMIIAGVLELMSKTQFFAPKTPLPGKGPMGIQPPQPTVTQQPPAVQPAPPPQKKPPKKKSKDNFCPECGEKLLPNATFCVKCGKKL